MRATWSKKRYVLVFSAILIIHAISWLPQGAAYPLNTTYVSTNRKQKKYTANNPGGRIYVTPHVQEGLIIEDVQVQKLKNKVEENNRRLGRAQAGTLEDRVKKVIVEQLEVNKEQVVPSANFKEDLGADSLDFVELILALEEAFDIDITDDEAKKMETVQDAIDIVKKKLTESK